MNIVMRMISILLLGSFVLFLTAFRTNDTIAFAEMETGVKVGQKAAPFTLLAVDGKELELNSFAKDKVTLLVFGATWCPACRHEIPVLKEYYSEFKDDGLNVLGIDIQESKKKVEGFVEKYEINYPVALDSSASVARLYEVVGIPLNVLLDKNGVIRYREHVPPGKEILKELFSENR